MMLYDVIIIGGGPAGVFSALGLKDKNVLMIDVGFLPQDFSELTGNLHELRQKKDDLFESLIGKNFESLHNLYREKISYKLKSPYMSYILKDWRKLSDVCSDTFETMMTFAKGGFANAWGAGVYEFTNKELINFPISKSELDPYYKKISMHIGISGQIDDLYDSFGKASVLIPPLQRSQFFNRLLSRYYKNKNLLKSVKIGVPRLAVLSKEFRGRTPYTYDCMDFFKPYNPAVYNPVFTLNELEKSQNFSYLSGMSAQKYHETLDGVIVIAKNINNDSIERFMAKKLIIAAGSLNSAKIILTSNNDTDTRLPILDNPMSCIPIVDWRAIGSARDKYDSPLAQLNLVYKNEKMKRPIQASFYGSTGPLRTDVIANFPLCISGNINMAKYLAPASALVMVFYPGVLSNKNYIKLTTNDKLEISYYDEGVEYRVEKHLMKIFRNLGYITLSALNQYPKIGNSLHYAGVFPMKINPGQYQTDANCKLFGTKNIYVVDGSCFTDLPAKNLTFTIMANALRVSENINKDNF